RGSVARFDPARNGGHAEGQRARRRGRANVGYGDQLFEEGALDHALEADETRDRRVLRDEVVGLELELVVDFLVFERAIDEGRQVDLVPDAAHVDLDGRSLLVLAG